MLQFLEFSENKFGVETSRIVLVDEGEPDNSIAIQNKRCRNRKFRRAIFAVHLSQPMVERFICLQKFFRKREHNSKAAGNDVADVAENRELQVVFLFSGERVIWKLGRNCDERSTKLFNLRQNPQEFSKFDVAVWAPSAAIKGDHHGTFVQHSLEPDGGTVRIFIRMKSSI